MDYLIKQSFPSQLQYKAAIQLETLILSGSSLLKVLLDWEAGKLSEEQVQSWASFIKYGHVVNHENRGPIDTIDIDYDISHEEEIIEIIKRLEELGEIIDGEISPEELQQMKESLRASLLKS